MRLCPRDAVAALLKPGSSPRTRGLLVRGQSQDHYGDQARPGLRLPATVPTTHSWPRPSSTSRPARAVHWACPEPT